MTSIDYRAFRASWKYRVPMWLWASGFIVASPGQLLATFMFHNRLEARILFITGMVMMLPFLTVGLWLIHKSRQELRRLEIELIVYEVLLKVADPETYKRTMALQDVKKWFKNKNLFNPRKKEKHEL